MFGSPKLDGLRVLNMNCAAKTSSLKPVNNRHTNKLISHMALDGLDGECTIGAGDTPIGFRKATSAVMAEEGVYDILWHVFDIHTHPEIPYDERLEELIERVNNARNTYGIEYVRLVPQVLIKDLNELTKYETDILALGFEGVMLRRPDGRYKYDRSTLNEQILLKLKRGHEKRGDAMIIGFTERYRNDNPPYTNERGLQQRPTNAEFMFPLGELGSFQVRDTETGVEFSVGMGVEGTMDDAFRKYVWEHKEEFLHQIMRYTWFAYGGYDKPRFPKYVSIRHPDDITV